MHNLLSESDREIYEIVIRHLQRVRYAAALERLGTNVATPEFRSNEAPGRATTMPEVRTANGFVADRAGRKDARGSTHIRVRPVRLRRECRRSTQLKQRLIPSCGRRFSIGGGPRTDQRQGARADIAPERGKHCRPCDEIVTAAKVRAQPGRNGIHLPPGSMGWQGVVLTSCSSTAPIVTSIR
jgi:hypothetical protein